ncbi:MAG: MATE family efflux transporter [Firmicutes bacterium]|nr:MATE family efflux transporter [Bacillota bacterium]
MSEREMSEEITAPADTDLDTLKLKVRRSVLLLAWPAVVEMVLQMSVGIADMVMVGRLGAAALASVEITNRLITMFVAVFSAISTGATALVARHIGAEEPLEANKVARQSLVIAFMIALLISAVGLIWAEDLTRFMLIFGEEVDQEVVLLGSKYLAIVSASLPLAMVMLVVNAILRGAGDTKTPMWITFFINILNIIGNYVFIFGKLGFPALGVAGAALSSALSRSLGGLIVLLIIFRGNYVINLSLSGDYRPDWQVIKRVLNIGIPAALEQFVMRGGQMLYGMIVAGMGTTVIAAHAIALTAESLSFMPGFGFALASMTLAGQSLGANDPERAEMSVNEAAKIAMTSMSIMGLIFFLWAEPVISLFTSDSEVLPLASVALRIVAVSQPALAWVMVLSGGLRGAGDTRYVLYIMAAGVWGFRIPLAQVLGVWLGLGLVGAWLAMIIDLFVRMALFVHRFRGGKWKMLSI